MEFSVLFHGGAHVWPCVNPSVVAGIVVPYLEV